MFIQYLGALVLALSITSAAPASENLARKYNCLACHQAERRSVGPSYQDIAAQYQDQADAAARVAERIKRGSVGVWGRIPMPPNPRIPDADLEALTAWILEMAE